MCTQKESEAKPMTQSEMHLNAFAKGDPKVKAFLLAEAVDLIKNVEMKDRPSGFVTYLAGRLGLIHSTIAKMEWDKEGKDKDRQHFAMKEALLQIIIKNMRDVPVDHKCDSMADVAKTVLDEFFPDSLGRTFPERTREE